jgi:hypothetical protein
VKRGKIIMALKHSTDELVFTLSEDELLDDILMEENSCKQSIGHTQSMEQEEANIKTKNKFRGGNKHKKKKKTNSETTASPSKRKLSDHSTPENMKQPSKKQQTISASNTTTETRGGNSKEVNMNTSHVKGKDEEEWKNRITLTYSQAAKRRGILLRKEGHPEEQLTEMDLVRLEYLIEYKIDSLERNDLGPVLLYRVLDKGSIKFACLGEDSLRFIMSAIRDLLISMRFRNEWRSLPLLKNL